MDYESVLKTRKIKISNKIVKGFDWILDQNRIICFVDNDLIKNDCFQKNGDFRNKNSSRV